MEIARESFKDEETRYLFNPRALNETPLEKVIEDMKKHNLSKKPRRGQ